MKQRGCIRNASPLKTENLKTNSGESGHSLGCLALVVGSAVGGHGALLGSLVDGGSKRIVSSHSGLLVLGLNSSSYLLAKGANTGHGGTVNSGTGNRLTNALLSGLCVSHSRYEKWFFVLCAGEFT